MNPSNRPSRLLRVLRRLTAATLVLFVAGAGRAGQEAVLLTDAYAFRMSGTDGSYQIVDRATGTSWDSNPRVARFGEATLQRQGLSRTVSLSACNLERNGPGWTAVFLDADTGEPIGLRIHLRPTWSGRALEICARADSGVVAEEIRLLDDALGVADTTGGYALVPVREGLRIPADSGREFTHRFNTYAYEGCHMAMFGLVQSGTALLATWDDPYTALELKSVLTPSAGVAGRQVLLPSLTLRQSARALTLHFLGAGDENTVAHAYRDVARAQGWLVTWDDKLRDRPDRARLFGASNYKLWSALDREMSEDSRTETSVRLNWTFEEAARVAEHLKQDLELDRVLFLMGGWIRRGYDNQHPDILPAAPECGGNEALARCARRVRELGYVFGLHDNYQDIYRDSPSWDENLIMKRPDGSLASGGHWAGGRAFLTCSREAVSLAMRPQNLPAVFDLTRADAYFIDTTYAAGLQECFDPNHPLTFWDDLHWKQVLSDRARTLFGIFGSECGREWAIPHSDFFEGLTGVSGRHFHDTGLLEKVGGIQVPLFELVYHDTLAMYGKYGYEIRQAADYVLHHVSLARPLHYHSIPAHLYWQEEHPEAGPLDLNPGVERVVDLGDRGFEISYAWEVEIAPDADWRVFVHFTDAAGRILFQNDYVPSIPTSQWLPGRRTDGPYRLRLPATVDGPVEVRMGLFQERSLGRAQLVGPDDGESRRRVGTLTRTGGQLVFEPRPAELGRPVRDPGRFVRADQGWAEGMHPLDRFLKNTHEILGPLNDLTARLPMSRFEFLTPDLSVRRTVFGQGDSLVTTVVNLGTEPFAIHARSGEPVVLPPGGLLAEASTWAAFCATQWNGVTYPDPVLFTLSSLDGRSLDTSRRVRIFHGFGDGRLRWRGQVRLVGREMTWSGD